MRPPRPPRIQRLDRITPTIYESARTCAARAAWTAHGERGVIPRHPRALLGICVHSVLESARRGLIAGDGGEERRELARQAFDDKVRELFAEAHPLLRAKFDTHDRLPYYNVHRERAALIAAKMAPSSASSGDAALGHLSHVEYTMESRDRRVAGRPDVVDRGSAVVIDYKTGSAPESGSLSEAEERQLKLYAFLASENGVEVRRGIVLRADRSRAEIDIPPEAAQAEGKRAVEVLESYNQQSGRRFEEAAAPSPKACRFCPCIPFCEAFWIATDETWSATAGTHVEGEVIGVQGDALVAVELEVDRGAAPRGHGVLTRLSERWLTFDGTERPVPGDVIRATNVRQVEETSEPAIFRADRVSTAVWQAIRTRG